MKLFSYSPYDDTGGIGWGLSSAFTAQRPDWEYHAVTGAPSYLQFPQHDAWHWPDIMKWWSEADAVHVHDGFHQMPDKRKGIVVTWHGTGFREVSQPLLKTQREYGATGLVSTLDLWLLAPDDVTWCPAPYDLDWLASLRKPQEGPLRIAHSPTAPLLKSTAEFIAACDRLIGEGADIEPVIIQGRSWLDCLAIKATCDVTFDQTAFCYAGSAIEAWGLGHAVVCGSPDPVLNEYERRFGHIPFLPVTKETIYDGLAAMLDPAVREDYVQKGRAHAEKFHSQRAVVELLTPIYEAAANA